MQSVDNYMNSWQYSCLVTCFIVPKVDINVVWDDNSTRYRVFYDCGFYGAMLSNKFITITIVNLYFCFFNERFAVKQFIVTPPELISRVVSVSFSFLYSCITIILLFERFSKASSRLRSPIDNWGPSIITSRHQFL